MIVKYSQVLDRSSNVKIKKIETDTCYEILNWKYFMDRENNVSSSCIATRYKSWTSVGSKQSQGKEGIVHAARIK